MTEKKPQDSEEAAEFSEASLENLQVTEIEVTQIEISPEKPIPQPKKTKTLDKNTTVNKKAGVTAVSESGESASTPVKATPSVTKPKANKKKVAKAFADDLDLDIEEKEDLDEENGPDLHKILKEDDENFETTFVPTDTSERFILVVDEDGKRRNETVTIVSNILPNAVVEVADDPEEALEMMIDCEFDTYVVNFLMPGFSASPFVKAVANHPDHPLLIGFAADKISDAIDPKKGLKIIPLKRLFDLDDPALGNGNEEGKTD